MFRQRRQTVMRQIAGIAAFISLSLGSLLPADCCRAAQGAETRTAAHHLSCCQQPAAVLPAASLDGHCGSTCCGAFGPSNLDEPAGDPPSRCQLQPRDSQLFLTAARLTVVPEDAVVPADVGGEDLVTSQQPSIASVRSTGPPPRPVRVLYGVWRN